MNEEQLVAQIKGSISQIKNFDKSRLYPNGPQVILWNNYSRESLKKFVDTVFDLLFSLEKRQDINLCGVNILGNINSYLTNFIDAYASVTGLVDAQITSHHHQSLTYLTTVNDHIRSTGLYTELKLDPKENFSRVSEALKFGDELLKNKVAFEKTSEIFKEALGNKDKFIENLLLEKSQLFENTAHEYKTFTVKKYPLTKTKYRYLNNYFHFFGGFWQMVLSIIFGMIIMFVVYTFIQAIKDGQTISPGVAALRISALIVPSYFAFFFSKQFQLSKKMYQYYKFKSVALSTMSNLYAAYPNHQDKIIDKALTVIFSEFSEKNNNELSQKDLLDLVTKVLQK